MSSTSDTGPISQAVEVADEVEHHTLVEKIEEAIEGAEEAVSHFVLGTDKEGPKAENDSDSIEDQTTGESKDEPTDGAIGIPVEKTDLEIPITSAPPIDPKDDISHDVIMSDEHTPTSIPNTETSKSEDADIIHHNEGSGNKSEGELEAAKEEMLILSSDEAQAEEHLGTDDTKESQAAEVESVQESEKEEPALLTHDGTEPHATPALEEIPPAPKHEAEGGAASTETPIEISPEHLEHSSLATDSENTQLGVNASADEPTHVEPEAQGTVEEPERDHTAFSDFAPAITPEVEPETHVGDTKEESDAPHIGEAKIEPSVTEEERATEVTQGTLLETTETDESELSQYEEVSIVEEAPAVQEKALEAVDKTEEPTESAPTVDNHEVENRSSADSIGVISSEPSHDQIDALVVDNHDVPAPGVAEGQPHITNEEDQALAEKPKLETESSLVEESQSEVPNVEEALYEPTAEITIEAIPVSEEPQEEPPVATEPNFEGHAPEPPQEEVALQETDSTPKAEASVEENSSEEAATGIPISAEVISEVKGDEAIAEPGPATDITPEKETEEVHEECAEVTTLAETTKVDEEEEKEEEAPVQKDEVSTEPPMVEEQKPEEQVILTVELSEYVEEPAAPAATEETEHETEANGQEEVHFSEVKEEEGEEPKSCDEIVQESAPEAMTEETRPEPEAITSEAAHIEEAPVTSETIDESPAPTATEEHESSPGAEAATEQTVLTEESAPVSTTADEYTESTSAEERGEGLVQENNGESSAVVESEEVKEEVKKFNLSSCD